MAVHVKTLDLGRLRKINRIRCKRWQPGGICGWSLSDWATATAGELGEACNIVKKMNRERDGLAGNTETTVELNEALANELADTLIYLDLLASRAGINLGEAVIRKFNATSRRMNFPERL